MPEAEEVFDLVDVVEPLVDVGPTDLEILEQISVPPDPPAADTPPTAEKTWQLMGLELIGGDRKQSAA